MFKKILIANRGEIALRIIRACRELGIKTVAVYSKADELSLHTKFADEAICIGPNESSKSYLNIPSILAAVELTDADAIHPGYGFLSESAKFSAICKDNNISFIGSDSETINLMGNKSLAKDTMKSVGVPIIPGSDGNVDTFDEAKFLCDNMGYPVIIKAASGGGGKGMRLVNDETELKNAYEMAKVEAEAAFSDGNVYIEKFLKNLKVKTIDRPQILSNDRVFKMDVIAHATKYIERKFVNPDIIVSIQANSPEITYKDIDGAINHMIKFKRNEVISVDKNGNNTFYLIETKSGNSLK